MDVHSKEQRSYNMSMIRSSKTKPELILRTELRKAGFIYQPKILGKPDFIDETNKVVIFVDGCFWHRCQIHYKEPKTNKVFWKMKIRKTLNRDHYVRNLFEKNGYLVIKIWEHEIMKTPKECLDSIKAEIMLRQHSYEVRN